MPPLATSCPAARSGARRRGSAGTPLLLRHRVLDVAVLVAADADRPVLVERAHEPQAAFSITRREALCTAMHSATTLRAPRCVKAWSPSARAPSAARPRP